MENIQKKLSFHLLTLITTPKLAEKAAEMFKKAALPLQYRFNAEGTATSEIMDMMGLGSVDKCMLISVIPKEFSGIMLDKLRTELQMNAVNSGVAFTLPLNGMNNLILRILTQNAEENISNPEAKEKNIMTETKHVLIAAIINRGFSEDVMKAAKSAGAKGGTVIHSRRIGNEEATGFWGLSMQDEKDIVLILSNSQNKVEIMQKISQKCGMHSDAKGIVMSLPIDSVAGFQEN